MESESDFEVLFFSILSFFKYDIAGQREKERERENVCLYIIDIEI